MDKVSARDHHSRRNCAGSSIEQHRHDSPYPQAEKRLMECQVPGEGPRCKRATNEVITSEPGKKLGNNSLIAPLIVTCWNGPFSSQNSPPTSRPCIPIRRPTDANAVTKCPSIRLTNRLIFAFLDSQSIQGAATKKSEEPFWFFQDFRGSLSLTFRLSILQNNRFRIRSHSKLRKRPAADLIA